MSAPRRPGSPGRPLRSRAAGFARAIVAGTLLLGSVGSCELPKPKIPSIGDVCAAPAEADGPGPRRALPAASATCAAPARQA
ncbi:MAG: hypothetical protein M0T75_07835 [Chloroflexi bacterium]|nr:hypothetical protein [Chloroflexota bacterium]